jgi:hypothetical protein
MAIAGMPMYWLIIGNTAQPTALGFVVTACCFWVLAFKLGGSDDIPYEAEESVLPDDSSIVDTR